MEIVIMEILAEIEQSIASDKHDEVIKLENEIAQIQESNPYKISDKLREKGFESTSDGLYRYYGSQDLQKIYLGILRESGNGFKINYGWFVKENLGYTPISPFFSSTKTIFEDTEKRNKILGKYTKDFEIVRNKSRVAAFLNETWKLIIDETKYLNIFKDKNTEFRIDKYSSMHIMEKYIVLSDVVSDDDFEFRLLYVKSENYTLFMHNNVTGENKIVATFDWQETPSDIKNLDDTVDDKLISLYEKLQEISFDLNEFKIKDALLNSLIQLEKDMNKKMEILNNASKFIKDVIVDAIAILREKYFDNLHEQIIALFNQHKSPTKQMLADYLNTSDEFFIVHDIKKRFKKTSHGFVEITAKDISNFFNDAFGYNKISMKRCFECMDYITRELTIDYDVIQFKNGLYNTNKGIFYKDKFADKYIPKTNLYNFSYHEDAESEFKETELYKEIHKILDTEREKWHDWNEHIFYKSIGSCYCGTNVADKMFIIVGRSWSRKSTLLSIIKRIFDDDYCNLKIQKIVNNERFELIPTVNKAILIDDDASDLQLKNIGSLNSFITGTGLYVEFKNVNDGVHLNENNTPRIWCASNELFNVIGSGFKRRLCLILADNVFPRDESSKQYMIDINNGERDKELELLISYSLQVYLSEKDSAFLTQEQEDLMYAEFEFRSYPERRFVQEVFAYADDVGDKLEDESFNENSKISNVEVGRWFISYNDKSNVEDVGDESDNISAYKKESDNKSSKGIEVKLSTFVPKKHAAIICRKYLKYQREQGTIFDSQAIPSSKKIKTAMEMFGFSQTKKNYTNTYGNRSSIDVFENIVIKDDWIERLGLAKLVKSIKNDFE